MLHIILILVGTFLTTFFPTMVICTKWEIGDRKDGSPLFIGVMMAVSVTILVGGLL